MEKEDQKLDGNYDIHVPLQTKDGKRYKLIEIPPIRALSKDEAKILHDLYGILWTDAYYDASNDATREYAKKLVDMLKRLNDTLHFKD